MGNEISEDYMIVGLGIGIQFGEKESFKEILERMLCCLKFIFEERSSRWKLIQFGRDKY